MKSIIKLLTLAVLFSAMLVSCSDDDSSTNNGSDLITPKLVTNLDTYKPTQGDTIAYYSLRENKQIDASKANTNEWDIAFLKTSIFVNQGFRGPGQGGGFLMKETDFETLASLPNDSTFRSEVSETEKAIPTGSDKGWYHYDMANSEISAIPGVVLAIRTADGRYAKMKVLNYYKGYPDSIPTDVLSRGDRFYSFKYVFQADGSKSFKK